MKRAFKQNLVPFIATSAIMGSAGFGFIFYQAKKNQMEHEGKMKNEQLLKDTTRPQYEYFGINWGYRADAIVKDKLDSGDILFMKFECYNCTNVSDMILCHLNNLLKPYPHFDSIGVVYRDLDGVYVIYDRLGKTYSCNYVECLCEPFWDHLSVRKLKLADPLKSKEIHKSVAKLYNDVSNSNITIHHKQLLSEILKTIDIVDPKYKDKIDELMIEDLDDICPKFFKDSVNFSQKIIIRNRSNKDLDS